MRSLGIALFFALTWGCTSSSENTTPGNGGSGGAAGSSAGGNAGNSLGGQAGAASGGASGASGSGGTGGAPGKKIVFAAYGLWHGNLTDETGLPDGLDAADALCTLAGNNIDPQKTWKAFISTSTTSAFSRVTQDGEWYLPDATTLVFPNKGSWQSGPDVPIDQTDYTGNPPLADAWTGSAGQGQSDSNNCKNWTSADGGNDEGMTGKTFVATSEWLAAGPDYCNMSHTLYCFQE